MKNKWLLCILLLVLSCRENFAGSYDTTHIQKFNKNLVVRTFVATRKLSLFINSMENRKNSIEFQPNVRTTIGLGFNYKFLGFNFTIPVRGANTNADKFGRTKYRDFQVNYYGEKFGGDLNYQDYQGFYIRNATQVFPDWTSKQYPIRQDLHVLHAGVNAYYVFNHRKFSYKAVFVQNERQLRSAGSLLFMASASYLELKADSSMIPELRRPDFGYLDFVGGRFKTISLLPGYAYVYVLDNFFVHGSALLGAGLQSQTYRPTPSDPLHNFSYQLKGLFRIGVGYSKTRFFAGIHGVIDAESFPTNKDAREQGHAIQVVTALSNMRILVGYRL